MKLLISLTLLALAGCAHGIDPALPRLMGPADTVECSLSRSEGLEGTYECVIKGRYIMEEVGLF